MKYKDTQSKKKQIINNSVANRQKQSIESYPGSSVVCLDGETMKTTDAYIAAGIPAKKIFVVERDPRTISKMLEHDKIPQENIIHGDISDFDQWGKVSGCYFDSMGNNLTVIGLEHICSKLSREREKEKQQGERKKKVLSMAVTMSKRVKRWAKGSRPICLKRTGARKNTASNRIKDFESIMKYYALEFKQTGLIKSYKKDENSQPMCWFEYDITW